MRLSHTTARISSLWIPIQEFPEFACILRAIDFRPYDSHVWWQRAFLSIDLLLKSQLMELGISISSAPSSPFVFCYLGRKGLIFESLGVTSSACSNKPCSPWCMLPISIPSRHCNFAGKALAQCWSGSVHVLSMLYTKVVMRSCSCSWASPGRRAPKSGNYLNINLSMVSICIVKR